VLGAGACALGRPALAQFGDVPVGFHQRLIGPGEIFTFLFIMVGPLNVLGPFAQLTRNANGKLRRDIALGAFGFSTVALLVGAYLGKLLLQKWEVTIGALMLAAGILLFLVALKKILAPDPPEKLAAAGEHPTMALALSPLAFPTIVTPYGVATVIIFLVLAPQLQLLIVGLIVVVMLLDLAAMLAGRAILRAFGVPLQVLGAVLGVMQAALGTEVIVLAVRRIIAGG
jgi:multiple antibiotic resistance protein